MVAPRLSGIVHDFPGIDVATLLQEVLDRIRKHLGSSLCVQWEIDSERPVSNIAEELRSLHEETAAQFVVERRGWYPGPRRA